MLPTSTSPNSVIQVGVTGTPVIDGKRHPPFEADERLAYSHYLNMIKNSEGSMLEEDASATAPSSSSLSNGMDMYLSPHAASKDFYGPNVAKYYRTTTISGEDTSSTSSASDSMSNIALSDLYSCRDEFSILHSDMRPSEAPWLYAVNKQKAKELLMENKAAVAASSSSVRSKKQVSPRFNIISKRIIPRINDKKKTSPSLEEGRSMEFLDENEGKDHIIDNSYYVVLRNSVHRNRAGVLRVVVLSALVVLLFLYRQSQDYSGNIYSVSRHWKMSASSTSETSFAPTPPVPSHSIPSSFWKYFSSTSQSVSKPEPTSLPITDKMKSKLKSRRKNRVPLRKKIKSGISKISTGFVNLSVRLSKDYIKIFAATLCLSQAVMFVTSRIFF